MKRLSLFLIVIGIILLSCKKAPESKYEIAGKQSKIIASMIDAVNEKNAEKYVSGFAENVKVFVESEMKVNGREDMRENRANHFKNHPNVRSEIQHLVEIDSKVIMHDKVWLDEYHKEGHNIVEIFTFENGEVKRVDVIQPTDLFRNVKVKPAANR